MDESTLLPCDFDANLLRLVFLNQAEEVIDRVIHGLALADAIDPEPVSVGIIGPNRDHGEVCRLFFRGGKVGCDVEVEGSPLVEQVRPVVPADLFLLHQPFFLAGDPEHQLLVEGRQLASAFSQVILALDVVVAETVGPGTLELFPSAGVLLTDRPDVHVPLTRLDGLDEDVFLVERGTIEDHLATGRIESVVHTLVDRIVDREHRCPRVGIFVAYQIVEHCHSGTLTEDLRTTNTSFSTEHLDTQHLPLDVLEFQVVVGELRFRHPLLQELRIVVTKLDVLACVLDTVVHGVGHVDHSFHCTEARKVMERGKKKTQVLHKESRLRSTTKAEVCDVRTRVRHLVKHLQMHGWSLVTFTNITVH